MLKVIAFIVNLFAPIVQPLGVLGIISCVLNDDYQSLYPSGIMAAVGLILGLLIYRMDIPPRWFWAKSENAIFRFSVAAVVGYVWSFAAWPPAIHFVQLILGPALADIL